MWVETPVAVTHSLHMKQDPISHVESSPALSRTSTGMGVTHSLTGVEPDASEDGTGRGTPIIAIGIDSQLNGVEDGFGPLAQSGGSRRQAVAFAQNQRGELRTSAIAPQLTTGGGKPGEGYPAIFGVADDTAYSLRANPSHSGDKGDGGINTTKVASSLLNPGAGGRTTDIDALNYLPTPMGVRRLTPVECERLMGWPDGHTSVGASGKEMSDSTRYRMCGNGVVSNVAEYIARRIRDVIDR